jgi:hypothetical protein
MKNKRLKKIIKNIFNEVNSLQDTSLEKQLSKERVDYAPYDSEVSEKAKNLILKLINYSENVNISFSTETLCFTVPDITSIKKKIIKNALYNDDNYLDIRVIKGEGFSINLAYQKRSNYEDKEMFNELIDITTKRVMEINRENFSDIWDRVMKDSGIIRDNNLEQLFDE